MTGAAALVVPELEPRIVYLVGESSIALSLYGLKHCCGFIEELFTRLCKFLAIELQLGIILDIEGVYEVNVVTGCAYFLSCFARAYLR